MSGLLTTVTVWPDFSRPGNIYQPDAVPVGHSVSGLFLILFGAQLFASRYIFLAGKKYCAYGLS